jgi:uncharacterized protein (DUF924 family)
LLKSYHWIQEAASRKSCLEGRGMRCHITETHMSSQPLRAPATPEGFVALESHAGRGVARPPQTPRAATDVVAFWRDAGPARWFAKDPAFDRLFRERFLDLHLAATRAELGGWLASPEGALALLLLLDQFPRNAFRGTPRMYASDALARQMASAAIEAGHDRVVQPELRAFFYLPFGHSEDLADQERAVTLCRPLGQPTLSHAEGHRDIVRRFGRFPHRNPILGRPMTPEEQAFLDAGGFAG